MSEDILDLTRQSRRALREKRQRCRHDWRKLRGGVEKCDLCGDEFPCRGMACEHLDCIERAIEMKRRGFPRSFSYALKVIADDHGTGEFCKACVLAPDEHYSLDVDPTAPPEQWVLPAGWRLSDD